MERELGKSVLVLYSHDHYTYTYTCRIITTTQNKDERHRSLRKIFLSLYWKGCVWEGVGDRIELKHIDPHCYGHNSVSFPFSWAAQPGAWGPSLSGTCSHSMAITVFLSRSPELLNRGPGDLASLGHVLIPASSLQLQLLKRGPEAPLFWVLVFSTASYLQLVWSPTNWLPVFTRVI